MRRRSNASLPVLDGGDVKMAWAFFQACDDFRIEANGRCMPIGTYSELIFPKLPARLDYLVLSLKLRTERSEPADLVALKLKLPGVAEPLIFPISIGTPIALPPEEAGAKLVDVQHMFPIGPIAGIIEGRIRLWALTTVEEEVYAGSLPVRAVRPTDRPTDRIMMPR